MAQEFLKVAMQREAVLADGQAGEISSAQPTTEQVPLLLTGALQDILVANQSSVTLLSNKWISEILIGPPPLSGRD